MTWPSLHLIYTRDVLIERILSRLSMSEDNVVMWDTL